MSLVARLRPAVAVLATAAGGLGIFAVGAPAAAAPCQGSAGVSVVVEYGALDGGIDQSCVPEGGGRSADRLLKDAGHALDYVQRFPGFVCRIDGLPADDPCVNSPPADAYWGLWWSDGETGKWTYSSLGAGSLTIPAGGYVAMVWDDSAGEVRPRTGAPAHPTPTPTPSPTPTTPPSPSPTPTPTPSASATATSTSTAQPTARPSRTKKPTKTPWPSEQPTTTTAPSSESASDEQPEAGGVIQDPVNPAAASTDSGLPGWVAPVLVVVLLGAAGSVAVVRRRQR